MRKLYDRNRDIAHQPFRSVCYAPFTSLYFNPTGEVTPSCQTQKCNFECIMCDGVASSRIRKRREKCPPLLCPYDERFLDDLDEFLPHLRWARLYGGEPFLSSENYRVWSNTLTGLKNYFLSRDSEDVPGEY